MGHRWIQMHDADHDVPKRILELMEAKSGKDISHGNNAALHSERADGALAVFDDHPVPSRRETYARHAICRVADGQPVYEGGNLDRAMAVLLGTQSAPRRYFARPCARR